MSNIVYHPRFNAQCNKWRHATGHRKDCTCGTIYPCNIVTTDPDLFADHYRTYHADDARHTLLHTDAAPAWVRTAGKPWKFRLSNKPWEPKPFDVGATVQWVDPKTNDVMTGQVWSGHPMPKTKWVVADSNAYAVHERDLVETWLSVARARRDRGQRSNIAHERADAEYWGGVVAKIEQQLAELEAA